MPQFNVIFEGVTPSPAREVIAEAIAKAAPSIVLTPVAGRFGATEAIVRSGFPSDCVYASDISLFSSIIGYLADPSKTIDQLDIKFLGLGQRFSENLDASDPFDVGATAMIAVKYEQLKPKHQYAMNLRRELFVNRDKYRARIRTELMELVEGLGPIHYEIADLRDPIAAHRDNPDAAFYTNPPGYSAEAYVRMLHADTLSWAREVPDTPWDEESLTDLYASLTDAPMLAICYSINATSVPDSWERILAVARKNERVDYLVANRPLDVHRTFTEVTQAHGGRPRIFEVYEEQEITSDSVLDFEEIDRPTAMYYRDLFVHRLGTTQSEWYLAMTIDGRLVTVLGLNRQRFMNFLSGYVKETFGISVTSQRYKRIGRLFMWALTTTSFRDWMRKHGRYGIREMQGIETTSLTKHEVSKNDRSLMKLVSREKLPNDMWKLQYRADLRDETFRDCLLRWLDTQAHHSRSGAPGATQSGPSGSEGSQDQQGRRSRRRRRVEEAPNG